MLQGSEVHGFGTRRWAGPSVALPLVLGTCDWTSRCARVRYAHARTLLLAPPHLANLVSLALLESDVQEDPGLDGSFG